MQGTDDRRRWSIDTPNIAGQNVNGIYCLQSSHFVIMRTELLRFYIGEVLGIYKQGTGSRYGSINSASTWIDIPCSSSVFTTKNDLGTYANSFMTCWIS